MANEMTKTELLSARFAMLQENCRLRNENIDLRKQVELLRQKRRGRRPLNFQTSTSQPTLIAEG